MEIEELDLSNILTIRKFKDFYYNVFSKCFPKDEIGSVDAYLQIKQKENDEYKYHLSFAKGDWGQYNACFIYCWFPKIRMIAAEFACVEESYRGKGLAKMLMEHAKQQHDFKGMFGEVEEDNQTNLSIWKKYGFKHIPIKYQQLSLGDGRTPVDNMKLCVYSKEKVKLIPTEDVKTFVWHYYKYSQFCDDPYSTKTIVSLDKLVDAGRLDLELEDLK